MIAPTEKALVSRNAIPMTSPADDRRRREKTTAGESNQHVPFSSLGLKVMFTIKSFFLHRTENKMDIMPETAMPSVKKP
jgi:hypothetical protein